MILDPLRKRIATAVEYESKLNQLRAVCRSKKEFELRKQLAAEIGRSDRRMSAMEALCQQILEVINR